MIEVNTYNKEGKESGKIDLPENIFGLKWNADLVHQVVVSMEANKRTPIAHTKNRGDVSGGGIKPWKQKGTGRARHGSIRSPIWVHGGVAHGPRNEKNYTKKINKKMKAKALYTLLSTKLKDGRIIFVDDFAFEKPKTKEAKSILQNLSKVKGFSDLMSKKQNSAYIAISQNNLNIKKSFSNISNISLNQVSNINVLDLVNYKYLVLVNPKESLEQIESKM